MSINYQLSQSELERYKKYSGLNLPRHTSYPAVPFWKEYEGDKTLNKLGTGLDLLTHSNGH